jgi:peptidoglycan/LPS O-acetylase OafA/YrhL
MRTTTRRASPVSLQHLPGLDGIRGVAVLAIIATHTLGAIPGGFLSVDVFFALSGFLITSLLVAEWRQTSALSLGRFWSRRARRLLPALFLMLTAVGAGAALWPAIFSSPSLRSDTVATVFQVANWHFIADHTNYFLSTGQVSPLLHTWSLAIEEQFYLVWPILVLAVLTGRRPRARRREQPGAPDQRHRLRVLFAVAVTGAVASALWMAVLTHSGGDTTRSYYASDTRAQAILVGAALAIGSVLWGPARSRRARSAALGAGIVGVIGTALLWAFVPENSLWVFRGGFFVAALCTAGVITCVSNLPSSPIGTVLSWGPLRYVGRISYGMYLWYWPLVLVLSPTRTHLGGLTLLIVRLVTIIAVATASAYLVELPIRRGHLPEWWAPLAMPVAASLAVLTTFLATVEASGVAAASVSVHGATAPATVGAGGLGAAGVSGGAGGASGDAAKTDSQPVKVLIVGDSVAGTLGVGIGQVMSQYGVSVVNEGSPGCSVSMDQLVQVLWFTDPPGAPCQNGDPNALLAQWRAWVDQFNPDVVIYMARSEVLNQEVDSSWTHMGVPAFDSYLTDRFHQAVDVLGSRGAHVVLLTSPFYDTGLQPSGQPWPEDDPSRVTTDNQIIESLAGAPTPPPSGTGARSGHRSSSQKNQRLFSGNSKVTVIDAGSWLSPAGQFAATVDGVQARCSDGVHFTVAGGEWLAKRILPVVSLLGRAHQAASPSGTWPGPVALTPPSWYAKLPCTTS